MKVTIEVEVESMDYARHGESIDVGTLARYLARTLPRLVFQYDIEPTATDSNGEQRMRMADEGWVAKLRYTVRECP